MNPTANYMKYTLLSLFLFFSIFSKAQDNTRVLVEGRIIASDNEVVNVTVFNTSSNSGTVTDEDGQFSLRVMLNDVLEISALQFEKMNVVINEEIISSKKMTIFVVERINKLNEVLLLPYGLSGNIETDLETVRTFNPDLDAIYFGVDNIDEYEFSADRSSSVENEALWETHRLRYGLDFVSIFGLVSKEIFKGRKNKNEYSLRNVSGKNRTLIDVYSIAFISNSFDIPENQVNAFIAYVENEGINPKLFESGEEIHLLEFLSEKSKEFLKTTSEKD